MRPRAKGCIDFLLTVSGMALIVVVAAFLLNFLGDCGARNCGETERRVSFVVLAFGAIAIGYYAYRFVRLQKR
jgi:hypothetical protein